MSLHVSRPLCLSALVWLVACGGKTLDTGNTGDTPMAPNETPPDVTDPGNPDGVPDPVTDPTGPEPVDNPPDPISPPPEPPPPEPPPDVGPLIDRCRELCSVPEIQCQPTVGGPLCFDGCSASIPVDAPPHCIDTFFEMTFCMEEAALVMVCSPEFDMLFRDLCAPMLDVLRLECATSVVPPGPPPPPPPGGVECSGGSEAGGGGFCAALRMDCSDGHDYAIECTQAAGSVECQCYVDDISAGGFGTAGEPIPVEEYCYSPMGFDMCGFNVIF